MNNFVIIFTSNCVKFSQILKKKNPDVFILITYFKTKPHIPHFIISWIHILSLESYFELGWINDSKIKARAFECVCEREREYMKFGTKTWTYHIPHNIFWDFEKKIKLIWMWRKNPLLHLPITSCHVILLQMKN